MLPAAAKCSVCSEGDHHTRACPSLHEPLKEGFYKPSGGYQGGGDDEDEKAKISYKAGAKFEGYQCRDSRLRLKWMILAKLDV